MLDSTADPRIGMSRQDKILFTLKEIVHDLIGVYPEEKDLYVSYFEMGIDSLLLIQAGHAMQLRFGVKIPFAKLFEELSTINALAEHLDQILPSDKFEIVSPQAIAASESNGTESSKTFQSVEAAEFPQPAVVRPEVLNDLVSEGRKQEPEIRQSSIPGSAPIESAQLNGDESQITVDHKLEGFLKHQVDVISNLMIKQLDLLKSSSLHVDSMSTGNHSDSAPPTLKATVGVLTEERGPKTGPPPAIESSPRPAQSAPYIPYKPIDLSAPWNLPARQQRHLNDLVLRYTRRTQKSKRMIQTYRPYLADNRVSASFRPLWKEMAYPIVAERSQGSKLWDLDGNEYIDITMGFGVHLFGHSPTFITDALSERLKDGWALGPQTELAGIAAKLICELTNVERVNFCNSGTEALMGVMRVARTVRNRSKIALFAGAYHGWSDNTLVRPVPFNDRLRAIPGAPGVSPKAAEDLMVLEYGHPRTLEIIKEHADELAAVLVEPVQSRRPDFQPVEFLSELRELTKKLGVILIFDEMITGFRSHPGGVQELYGIEADLVTYGKVIGGGLPIGVVAGKSEFMDTFDGGTWEFGDNSFPRAEKTLMAGCYFKHPLAMAASTAVLEFMKATGPEMQEDLNRRTTRMADRLNTYFYRHDLPVRVVHFSSLFRFVLPSEMKYPELLMFHLLEKGIHAWEGGNYFLSTAHSDQDIESLIGKIIESVEELRECGFFPSSPLRHPDDGRQEKPSTEETATTLSFDGAQTVALSLSDTSFARSSADDGAGSVISVSSPRLREDKPQSKNQRLQFSIYYFGDYHREYQAEKYDLILESAKLADHLGFTSIWLPERHFGSFGGFSPNPAVLAAALARETEQISLRAGSIVLPLHNSVRVAEDWAVIDNLSKGRVGISFASGWHPNDFVFAPESYHSRREVMYRQIDVVRRLWRGESIRLKDGEGNEIEVGIAPLPMQSELPIWLTVASKNTAIKAGEMGAGFLTNFMDHGIDEVTDKIKAYRNSLAGNGFDPNRGHVTIQLHTFLGKDSEIVKNTIHMPFMNYLAASLKLVGNKAKSKDQKIDVENLSIDDRNFILQKGYDQYLQRGVLFGTPESCRPITDRLIAAGVNEICCLIDFGLDKGTVLDGLYHLNELRRSYEETGNDMPHTLDQNEVIECLTVSSNGDGTSIAIRGYESPTHPQQPSKNDSAAEGREQSSSADFAPLTDAQRQFWSLCQMSEEISSAYNESIVLHLRGPLNLPAMLMSVRMLVARHEALSITFSPEGDYQRFNRELEINIPVIDLSGQSEPERRAATDTLLKSATRRVFDFVRGPLFRIQITKLDDHDHLLHWTNHHIIVDGESIPILTTELSNIYVSLCHGEPYTEVPPSRYRNYLQRQLNRNQSEESAESEAFWLRQFGDSTTMLELPVDRMRPPMQTFRSALYLQSFGASLVDRIRAFKARMGLTMFMGLLAAFKVFLHRVTGQTEVVVMINTADSASLDYRNLVGYRVLPLALPGQVVGEQRFSEYCRSVKRDVLEAYEHQAVSLDRIGKLRKSFRSAGRLLPVSVGLNYGIESISAIHFAGLTVEWTAYPTSNPLLDLYLDLGEREHELLLRWNYNPDLFDLETIKRWAKHFEALWESITADPDRRIAELSFIAREEENLILNEWNRTQSERIGDGCIHAVIQDQVDLIPDRIAYQQLDEQISYWEIDNRSNQIASYLRQVGVGREDIVGICLDRSIEAVIGLLGILKSGAAFLQVDPGYPDERISFMLEEAGSEVLLTEEKYVSQLRSFKETVFLPSRDLAEAERYYSETPICPVTPENLAYLIFTSGSTGRPKGVLQTHRAAMNRFKWMWDVFPFEEDEVCCQKTSISFVDSIWEIFGPLLQGCRTVILPDEVVKDPFQLIDHLELHEITRLVVVPTLLRNLLDAGQVRINRLGKLKYCVTSGEAVSTELCASFREQAPQCILLNLYGSSEVSADATFIEIRETATGGNAPIGRPIDNLQIYLLDSYRQPVPIETEGEIYVGGAGLARGYLNHADLTAEKFLADPFQGKLGERVYRTGDLARYLPDGNLEFIGRTDHQVKIKGYRIELGEIESALNGHPGVREAALMMLEGDGGEKQLAAYVVPNDRYQDHRRTRFSLFYFAEDESNSKDTKYRLYLEGAKFADQNGFEAVWTPERHFHEVAGIYPNPSVLSAALATITQRVALRAGSVVLPHHHPVRVAEEWSVVDNLSGGRVGISFTSGWVPKDFAFFPEHFADKREIMFQGINDVRKLWRGEAIKARDGVGNEFPLKIFPEPVQTDLPIWLTCTSDPAMFIRAGELGVNVLTALLNQTITEVAEKIKLYRQTLEAHGHGPEAGRVTMMMHTFVGETTESVTAQTRGPFRNYIKAHLGLFESMFRSLNVKIDPNIESSVDDITALAFERYYQTASLIGTPGKCLEMVDRLQAIGVDEIACLIDFGVDFESVMEGLVRLNSVKKTVEKRNYLDGATLRNYLKKTLPEYMIPATFTTLDALPLTPGGKIDRQSLYQGAHKSDRRQERSYEDGSRPEMEKMLAKIWADVLGLEYVGPYDNFFELGGDSILGIRVAAKANQMGLQVSPLQLFQYSTLADLASALSPIEISIAATAYSG